jgi:hypothetical protein
MLRKTKVIGGTTLVAATIGIAVPAYATSSSPTAASTTNLATKATARHRPKSQRGLGVLGLTPAVIAKAVGTDVPGLKAGRAAKKSLTQIAASHDVSRAVLLSRLNATADAKVTTLINTKLPIRSAMGKGKTCTSKAPKAGAGKREARGLRGIPGIGRDVKSLASTLNVTPNVLRADLREGQTLQQIATAHRVGTATLQTALDKDVSTQLGKTVDRVPRTRKARASTSSSMAS